MRKCLRCGADMLEGFGINVMHGSYGIAITRNEKYRPFSKLDTPKVAICPECGELSLYFEDLEKLKTAAYYRDFKNGAKNVSSGGKRNKQSFAGTDCLNESSADGAANDDRGNTNCAENEIINLREQPEYLKAAAKWFASKWRVPLAAYEESMQECLDNQTSDTPGVPQWYIVMNEKNEIIAGAGVIANDFHDRPDLTPNLCGLFVEENYRKQGLAGSLLLHARSDLSKMGFDRLYLITDHTNFYERYGWEFLTMVNDSDGPARMYISPSYNGI